MLSHFNPLSIHPVILVRAAVILAKIYKEDSTRQTAIGRVDDQELPVCREQLAPPHRRCVISPQQIDAS
jgi:hypothetical protein